MLRHAPTRAAVVLGLAVSAAIAAAVVLAQVGEDEAMRPRVYPPTDRLLSRGMRRAEQSIARGEFSQAVAFLDEVLGRDEDFFTETGADGGFAGLKETARRLIRDLPRDGRRTYETTYGPVAERQLSAALTEGNAEGNSAGIAAVVERYFYTPAGYQAALVQAADHSDGGRHLAAALLYQQLLETPAAVRLYDPELSVRAAASWLAADDAAQAERVLAALTERGTASVTIAGRDHKLASNGADALKWLQSVVGEPAALNGAPEQQWLTYRGNAARNGESAGGLPHMRVRWKVPLLNHMKLEELFEEYTAELAQGGAVIPVASAPIAAGNYVLVRTPHGLLAVDFRGGKRIWRSELQRDPQLEQLMKMGAGEGAGDNVDGSNADAARAFARRMWEDYLYGMTSSDGVRAYVVRDLPMPRTQDYEMSTFGLGAGNGTIVLATNRLSAYDLERQGALAWEIDGAATSGELPGAFFLGAPLTLGPSLYALVEVNDSISLAVINRATGKLEWRQHLANLETGVLNDLRRRAQAAMPSYDGGMLVCPTGAGLVVGVDLGKRSLAWAYQYDSLPPVDSEFRGGPENAGPGRKGHWTDGGATIAEGRVLISPRESRQLHCLDLHTGRMLWRRDQEAMKQVACVYDGRVVMADSTGLSARKFEDGTKGWVDRVSLPLGVSPSGTGFMTEGKYFLPLTSGEVIAVDLADGRIVDRVRSRDGSSLGNLICHRGAVISQDGMSLECFDQVNALRQRSQEVLAKNPDDVDSLRSLGEIAYNEGRLSEAIDLTERAYRATPDDFETRDALAECLTAALDEDFASYKARLPLLKELEQQESVSRLTVLRIEAAGLLDTGDVLGSAEACFVIYRAAPGSNEKFTLASGHETLATRWVQAQLAAVWEAASGEQRAVLTQRVEAEMPELNGEANVAGLDRFLKVFGALPMVSRAKMELARQLEAGARLLESQQLLLDLANSTDEAVAREATARVAKQFHGAGLAALSREFDAQLAGKFADEPCLDGATGRELLDRWRAEEAGKPSTTIAWPTGRVEVGGEERSLTAATAAMRSDAPMWNIRLEHADSILGGGVGALAVRGGELAWRDGYGRRFFNANLEPQGQAIYRQSGSVYGSARGNYLVTSLGRELAAFNTLANVGDNPAPLLWRTSLGSNFEFQDAYLEDFSPASLERPGTYRAPRMATEDKWVGVIGPLTSSGCVFQDQRRLTCVDPMTGEVQWSRSDVPPG